MSTLGTATEGLTPYMLQLNYLFCSHLIAFSFSVNALIDICATSEYN